MGAGQGPALSEAEHGAARAEAPARDRPPFDPSGGPGPWGLLAPVTLLGFPWEKLGFAIKRSCT